MSPCPLILVVDDFDDGRQMYALYLAHHGFRVVEAVDGMDAIEQASHHLPDLIVMDLGMPRVDGWEATRRIKASPRTQHVRVLAISGHTLPDSPQRAREAGADGFLPKPCDPPIMLAKIREMLGIAPP